MKNKKSLLLIVFGVVLVVLAAFLLLSNKSSKKDKEEDNPIQDEPKSTGVSGLYSDGNFNIYIYRNDKEEVYITTSNHLYGMGTLDNNSIVGKIDNSEIKIAIDNDTITIETDPEILGGVYKKEKDLSFETFFDECFGSSADKMFKSKYNGIYGEETKSVIVYQEDSDWVRVLIDDLNGEKKAFRMTIVDKALITRDERYNYLAYIDDSIMTFVIEDLEDTETDKTEFTAYVKIRDAEKQDVLNFYFK